MELKGNSLFSDVEFYVAIVDPPNEFLEDLVANQFCKEVPLKVLGFQKPDEYIELLIDQQYLHMVPLLLVADVAARKPTVEKGVFMRTKEYIPRCLCVPYTTRPDRNEWQRLLDLGAIEKPSDIVNRLEDDKEKRLINILQEKVAHFKKSDDVKRITEFNKYLRDTKSVDTHQWSMLIEAARGTKEGTCLVCKSPSGIHQPVDTQCIVKLDKETTHKLLMDKMIEPDSWLDKLLSRDKLWFLFRLLVEDRVRYLLTYLYKWDPDFRNVFDRLTIPTDTDGWRIAAGVYEELVLHYRSELRKGSA